MGSNHCTKFLLSGYYLLQPLGPLYQHISCLTFSFGFRSIYLTPVVYLGANSKNLSRGNDVSFPFLISCNYDSSAPQSFQCCFITQIGLLATPNTFCRSSCDFRSYFYDMPQLRIPYLHGSSSCCLVINLHNLNITFFFNFLHALFSAIILL